jgi:hypothetical protein
LTPSTIQGGRFDDIAQLALELWFFAGGFLLPRNVPDSASGNYRPRIIQVEAVTWLRTPGLCHYPH